MKRVLFDTNVFVYAVGGPSAYRDACRAIVDRTARGLIAGEASVDLVQEFLHQRLRRTGDRALAVASARHVMALCTLHDVAAADAELALALFEANPRLTARDAAFAAVALNRGIGAIVTADRDLDDIPGLARIDPLDAAAVAGLGG